jgi:hypothetical protein
MKFPKIPPRAEHLMDFFEEGLHSMGAVCERSWHDRLEVLAEGDVALLLRNDGDLFSGELYFRDAGSPGSGNPENEVFPGCPLAFRLVEALWRRHLAHSRVCLSTEISVKAPPTDVTEKLWQAQFGSFAGWHATPFRPTWIFSVVASVRCEVQANDQSWSSHRLAFTLPDGERDTSLEFALEQMSPVEQADPDWPALDPAALSDWIGRALNIELAPSLSKIKERQQLFLRRELNRIDEYFENYARELRKRADRQHKEEAIKRYADRLEATRLEHNRRRIDQVERHTIHVLPHVDALLTVAESAFEASVTWRAGREERIAHALFVPRTRRWHARKEADRSLEPEGARFRPSDSPNKMPRSTRPDQQNRKSKPGSE